MHRAARTPTTRRQAGALKWVVWLGALVTVTAALRVERGQMEQVHVTLVYLLLVLGASANGGRSIGLTVATFAIAAIDFFFQSPYDTIVVHDNLDWLVLVSFYLTAIVATSLLARARREADEAYRRTIEARELAQLGAQTMRHGSPSAALHAIATLFLERLEAHRCVIRGWSEERGLDDTVLDAAPPGADAIMIDEALLARCGTTALGWLIDGWGMATACDPDRLAEVSNDALANVRTIVLPLCLEQRTVGVLVIADHAPLMLGSAERRFLTALAYYAAVALEWNRLSASAARASAAAEASRTNELVLVSASHDLRTPLTTIKALAQGSTLAGTATGLAIEEQVDRLTRLVSDVLELSRLERTDLPLDIAVNTAEDLVGGVVRQTKGVLDGRRLDVTLTLEPAALAGRFDYVASLRILANLIENAVHYTAPSGAVSLVVEREGDWVAFAVSDRGPGVAAAEREAIFEPFHRPASAPVDAGRVGLGLAIARRLAVAQGGSLIYAPRDGGGSVFILRVPRADLAELTDVGLSHRYPQRALV